VALVTLAGVACSSGGTTDPPPPELRLLVVALVRNDISPENRLEGAVAFFIDRDEVRLLDADARIVGPQTFTMDSSEPGVVPGQFYHTAPSIRPGQSWKIEATVFGPDTTIVIESEFEIVPQEFEVRGPALHPSSQPLQIEWDAVPDAEFFTVAAGSGYEIEVPATTTSHTIPASAFAGITPGVAIEIEVTAFNNFFVTIPTGISTLDDPDEVADRFIQRDNVDGANGTFGAATSVGFMVTLQ
jgi:hypothetical protein